MVTVKTPFDCIKTNKQPQTQEWVFLVVTWNLFWALGKGEADLKCWGLPNQPLPPAHPLSPCLVLSWPWCQYQHLICDKKITQQKYVCFFLCAHIWKHAQFPGVIHGKDIPKSVLAPRQAAARGWDRASPRSREGKWYCSLILLPNMLSSKATALDHNSWVSAWSLYLSKVVPTIYIFFAYSCILSNRLVILLVGLLL